MDISIIIEYLADRLDGLHHVLLDIRIRLHFLQQALEHKVLLL